MVPAKTFLILLVCLFQFNTQAEPISVWQTFQALLSTYLKFIRPVRLGFVESVRNSEYNSSSTNIYLKFLDKLKPYDEIYNQGIDDILNGVEKGDVIQTTLADKTIVEVLKNISSSSHKLLSRPVEADFKSFILKFLGDIENNNIEEFEDYGSVILVYFKDKIKLVAKYAGDFKEIIDMKDSDGFERFSRIMADIQEEMLTLDREVMF